jgi:predicted Rossmann fold nucleotide-binding protein DprA/Smf involved in DNA uptake
VQAQHIERGDAGYPPLLIQRLGDAAPRTLYALGDPTILGHRLVGLICSVQCPGSIVIKTFDLVRRLRDAGTVMIGGFHSPMENDCLDLLLRGSRPVIVCPARRLRNLKLGHEGRSALVQGRLLLLSCFGEEARRMTSAQAMIRNDMVAALSTALIVPHASREGRAMTVVHHALDFGCQVFTFADAANTDLIAAGAKVLRNAEIPVLLAAQTDLRQFAGV